MILLSQIQQYINKIYLKHSDSIKNTLVIIRMESNDRLNLQNDKDIEKIIPFEIEPLLFSDKVQKINRWNLKNERILILTTKSIFLFRKKQLRKKLGIEMLTCIIKNKAPGNNEFILHAPDHFDLRIQTERREAFLDLLKLRFAHMRPDITLRVYGLTTGLKDYHVTPNRRGGVEHLPPDEFRLPEEEIKSAMEYERESQAASSQVQPQAAAGSKEEQKKPSTVSSTAASSTSSSALTGGSSASSMDSDDHSFDFQAPERKESKPKKSQESDLKTMNHEQDEMRASVLMASRKEKDVKLEDFKLVIVLGRGTFGKVYLAELRQNKQLYAIKGIRKDVLLEFDQVNNTKLEKDILFSCDHPFLVGMDYLFQSQLRLYFVMPFVRGGELYKVFQSQKRFPEAVVKFYAAQIALAIGYLHGQGIAHRDLKLENILIDQDGYLKIIDYGLAKMIGQEELSMSFCGTPEYLAPEMVNRTGHDKNVDWWALGVLIYEMLIGVTPFYNRNRNMLLMKIKNSKVIFPDRTRYRIDYSDEIVDLIVSLLAKDKSKRLGFKEDGAEVLRHPFFADLDVDKLLRKEVVPPFKPEVSTDFLDTKFFNAKTDAKDLTETYVPEAKIREIEKKKDQFKDFDSKF